MEKRIKKEIEKALRNPCGELGELIKKYYSEADPDKGVIIRRFYFERRGFWATMRELRRYGFYMEKTTFYRLKDEVIEEIAMRACYEHLICPYGDEMQHI